MKIDLMPKLRVIVIDDEQIVADTLVQILAMHGYEAKACYSGEAALADAKEFRPEVILSDVRMPRIDGIETVTLIRVFLPECRMILFTASPVHSEVHERISELGFEFLPRPLHPREVLALLQDDSRWRRVAPAMTCPAAHPGAMAIPE
jgi:two-component system OmpR family response regulator